MQIDFFFHFVGKSLIFAQFCFILIKIKKKKERFHEQVS